MKTTKQERFCLLPSPFIPTLGSDVSPRKTRENENDCGRWGQDEPTCLTPLVGASAVNIYTSYPWLSPTFAFVSLEVNISFATGVLVKSSCRRTPTAEDHGARAFPLSSISPKSSFGEPQTAAHIVLLFGAGGTVNVFQRTLRFNRINDHRLMVMYAGLTYILFQSGRALGE